MATKNSAKVVFTLTVAAMLDMILFRWYIYIIYKTQNLEKLMMGKVREKHARYKKNAIAFWRKKIVDCYSLQAQAGRSDGQVPYELAQGAGRGCKTIQIEKGGAAKDPEKSRYGGGAGSRQLELEQELNLRLERAVQERVRERERGAAQETSPERRSAGR